MKKLDLRGKDSKQWDTQKPLKKYFGNLSRVILVDDSAYKSCKGEEENMVIVPAWTLDNPGDNVMEKLTNVLLETFKSRGLVNVRKYTAEISQRVCRNEEKAAESNVVEFVREKERIS